MHHSSSGGGSSSGSSTTVSTSSRITVRFRSTRPRLPRQHGYCYRKGQDGYKLDKLTITDAKGNTIPLTDKGNGKYTFVMPEGKVTVTPTFVADNGGQTESKSFADVKDGAWYADAVKYVSDKGLMSGTHADRFSPDSATTRGMLMTVLARYAGKDTTGSNPWYQAGMNWAKANGVSDGTSPNANITREQLVTMLYRYAGSPKADGSLSSFADAAGVSAYAADAMQWAVANGIVNGSNGKLNPQNNATRAQVAAILMRFCEMSK
ncbi:MAG: S-layer homology domain-containing protein [Butyricicoccus sp.]